MTILLSLVSVSHRILANHPVLLMASLLLMLAFFGLVIATLLHNRFVLKKEARFETHEETVHNYLTELVASTLDSDMLRVDTKVSVHSHPELKKELLFDPTARTLLRSEIQTLHKSIDGQAAKQLRTTYLSLGFLEECMEQLRSGDMVQKAEAINEFAEMEIHTVAEEIEPFLRAKDPELRILTQTFFSKISDSPLSYLMNYPFTLSKWDQVELINILSKRKMDKFPGLRALFNDTNPSIRAFSLLLTSELNLTSYYSAFIPALEDEDESVRMEAIKQLRVWHHPVAITALEALELMGKRDIEKKEIEKSLAYLENKIYGNGSQNMKMSLGIRV